jgi:hypothetical protein
LRGEVNAPRPLLQSFAISSHDKYCTRMDSAAAECGSAARPSLGEHRSQRTGEGRMGSSSQTEQSTRLCGSTHGKHQAPGRQVGLRLACARPRRSWPESAMSIPHHAHCMRHDASDPTHSQSGLIAVMCVGTCNPTQCGRASYCQSMAVGRLTS